MTDTYERLDDVEVENVRAYRRNLWVERAVSDAHGAREQVVAALRTHADRWADGLQLVTLANICLKGRRVGDLSAAQRYALVTLISDAEETT